MKTLSSTKRLASTLSKGVIVPKAKEVLIPRTSLKAPGLNAALRTGIQTRQASSNGGATTVSILT